jgi:starch-binding outer membrane protein, SusD/RagB family
MMKRNFFYTACIFTVGFLLFSCEDFLDPELDNRFTDEQMLNDPAYFEGLLLHAYRYQFEPYLYNFNLDIASDDAVTNDLNSNFRKMALGEWTAAFNPASEWTISYREIFYINKFLEDFESVEWSYIDPKVNEQHIKRLRGEAHGLRAWYNFLLLQAHAGYDANNQLLGHAIITRVLDPKEDFNIPRSSFADCVDHIMDDLNIAIENLPNTYINIRGDVVHNSTYGERFRNRISGRVAMAIRSRVALFAASPAYRYLSWEDAAKYAGELLKENGGVAAISSTGIEFYKNHLNAEIIWNTAFTSNNNMERENFPPSLFGSGRTNPSQNLVDIFPMANGFPIDHQLGRWNPNQPYAGRDPRLAKYIVYDGNTVKGNAIQTYLGAPSDGVGSLLTSTRTGYFLKKLMLEDQVNLVPGNVTQGTRFYTYFRFTEILLNYAEAANEAWGPDADPMGYGLSARDAIRAIRNRAGLPQADTYLNFFNASKEALRTLIRNERRIELCFEGHRFWDIRRWNDVETMQKDVSGVLIRLDGTKSYEYSVVENRKFLDHMIHGPIPYQEMLKNSALVQNAGW